MDRFCDESSEMVKAITDGLVKKHGADYDVASEIKRLKENYVKRV